MLKNSDKNKLQNLEINNIKNKEQISKLTSKNKNLKQTQKKYFITYDLISKKRFFETDWTKATLLYDYIIFRHNINSPYYGPGVPSGPTYACAEFIIDLPNISSKVYPWFNISILIKNFDKENAEIEKPKGFFFANSKLYFAYKFVSNDWAYLGADGFTLPPEVKLHISWDRIPVGIKTNTSESEIIIY